MLSFSIPLGGSAAKQLRSFLLHAIYDALKPQALIRLHVAPCDDPDCYQLEIACDTGSASTPPLRLSSEALCWLQAREFEIPRRGGGMASGVVCRLVCKSA